MIHEDTRYPPFAGEIQDKEKAGRVQWEDAKTFRILRD